MQNVQFLKEALIHAEKNVSFIVLTQKQLGEAILFTANSLLGEGKSVALVSFSTPSEEILARISKNREKLAIIDAFSKESAPSAENVAKVNNPGDLIGVQIALENAEKNLPGERVMIFDAINALSIYAKDDTIGKFFHMFNNKTRLEGGTAIIFTVKESTDTGLIEMLKEFSDRAYDYSELLISELKPAQLQGKFK